MSLESVIAGTTQSVATPTPGNTTRAAVEALFRHKSVFLWTAGIVLLATALITVFTPRTYESEMNILVRNARPDYIISPERNTGQIVQQDVTEERINSEIEVLKSKDVADVVVDPDWATVPLNERSNDQVKAHEKAVLQFSKHLTVELLRKSNVIRVAYVTGSAREATTTVERLLAAFLAKQREIERATGTSSFFANEADRYKRELDKAQGELAAYQQSRHIVSLGDKETTLETQITALEDAIRTTQVELTEASNRVASDKHELALLPPRLATQQRSVPNTQAVEQLTATLNNFQNKRTELLTRYQPTERLIAEVDQQIAQTSAALEHARATNGQESTTDVNPVYNQVKSVLTSSTTDLAALRGRLADLTGQRDKLRQQLTDVEDSTVDYTTLQSRVTELQGDYQLYSQKKNEAQIADAMDQQQLVNVAVAERPTFSAKAFRPQILLNAALGTFTALFLGMCAVFFAELGRDTIAGPWELEAVSKVRVLATIPMTAEAFPTFTPGSRPPGRGRRKPDAGPAGLGGTGAAQGRDVPKEQAVERADQGMPQRLEPQGAAVEVEVAAEVAPVRKTEEHGMAEEVSFGRKEEAQEVKRLDRGALKTFEQLATQSTKVSPARPVSPFALPVATVATEPQEVPEVVRPVVPPLQRSLQAPIAVDTSHRQAMALSPSQRLQLRRQEDSRDHAGRKAYVTYTGDGRR